MVTRKGLNEASPAIRRIPSILFVIHGYTLLIQLVAKPIRALIVMTQARSLPIGQDSANLLVRERRDIDLADATVSGMPLLLLRVEEDAMLFELVAQHVCCLVVTPRARLLALHQKLLDLIERQLRRPSLSRLLGLHHRHIDLPDRPRPTVSRLPLGRLRVKVHAVSLQMVTQPVSVFPVTREPRLKSSLLTLLHQHVDFVVSEACCTSLGSFLRMQL
mmetsp:Transcript_25494/g.42128  ORF Transcript_25494/g.42128 Transcript_25494/m.42128 type:complete len:218 (-) Transcript_25494:2070-2723(-)